MTKGKIAFWSENDVCKIMQEKKALFPIAFIKHSNGRSCKTPAVITQQMVEKEDLD